jgi:hypothetical protein
VRDCWSATIGRARGKSHVAVAAATTAIETTRIATLERVRLRLLRG